MMQKKIHSMSHLGSSLYGALAVIQYETPYTNVVYCIKREENIILLAH